MYVYVRLVLRQRLCARFPNKIKYMAIQQIILSIQFLTSLYLFVFLSKNPSLKTALKPSSYKSKFSSTRETSGAPNNCFLYNCSENCTYCLEFSFT